MGKKSLSSRERKFVEVYVGNGTAAARKAGYSGNDHVLATQATRLLKKPAVKTAIAAREKTELRKDVAKRDERQKFWSDTMRSTRAPLKERLRASELLGKSEADFTERLEVKGELTLEALVLGSMKDAQ